MLRIDKKINENGAFEIKQEKNTAQRQERTFLFFFLMYAVVQFVIFYIGVNINSILLAFQNYDVLSATYSPAGFSNFAQVISDIFVNGKLLYAVENSAILFASSLIGIPLQIIVAYGVFKKIPLSGFLKIMLFMPNMINNMVFVVCGEYLITHGFPLIFGPSATDLLSRYSYSSFWTILTFGFWLNLSSGLVIYLGSMSGIDNEVMEYCQLERLSSLRELWSIVVPLIFPTVTTYIIVAIAGFFTNYGFFFSFVGETSGPYDTLGFRFFVMVAGERSGGPEYYPYASAGGLMFTLVLTPITLFVRNMLQKYGPSED